MFTWDEIAPSVLQDEKVMEIFCSTVNILNAAKLKNVKNGKFYVTCFLPQFFKATLTALLSWKEKYTSPKTRMP